MRRLLVSLILMAMMATGCAKPAPPSPPAPGQSLGSEPGGSQGPGAGPGTGSGTGWGTGPGTGAGTGPGPGAPGGDLRSVITAAPADTFQHHQIQPGEAIDRLGIFVMKTATGAVEGWSVGGDHQTTAQYEISTDNRWISAQAGRSNYLLDRVSGSAFQWAVESAYLVTARGDTLLFRTADLFWTASADLKRITPVNLKPDGWPSALISGDGKAAALVNGARVHLLDLASSAIREIGALTGKREYGATWLANQGGQIVAGIDGELVRFDWTGKQLGKQSVPGYPRFSPDGRLVAWPSNLLGLTDTMVVAAASDLSPKFRLVSIDQCGDAGPGGGPWLADSSGLVVRTGSGRGYQILGADGTLAPLAAVNGERPYLMPVPAPDRADWFAVGGTMVVDRQGRQVAAAVPHSDGTWYGAGRLAPWGETSDEVRFALINWGKDFGCLPAVLPPEVQKAPFPVTTGLEVTVAAGDCVNLRQSFDLTAKVITCLPNGTKLTGSAPPGRLNKGYLERVGNPTVTDMGGAGWWYVRTETGQRGWVLLSGDYLKLAAAPAGAPAPDPVADLIRDETENLLWWFSVAEGTTECGPACAGIETWEWRIWPVAEWCRQSGPEYGYSYLRKMEGFDRARHTAGVQVLEGSCKAFQNAWAGLGEPKESPAWRDVVAKVKADIEQFRAKQ